MAQSDHKTKENRLRRLATRQGLRLTKSRSRDPLAREYGYYWLFNLSTEKRETARAGISLDRIENYLNHHDDSNRKRYTDVDLNLAQQQNMVTQERDKRRAALLSEARAKAEADRNRDASRVLHERMRAMRFTEGTVR